MPSVITKSLFVGALLLPLAALPGLGQKLQPDKPVEIVVRGVEQRSSCDYPREWFLQARNKSTTVYCRIRLQASVLASVWDPNNRPQCTVTEEGTFDVAPGECVSIQEGFYNGAGSPCDDPCCRSFPHTGCHQCTTIQYALVELLAVSLDGKQWASQEELICEIKNSKVISRTGADAQVINSCVKGEFLQYTCTI
jgi:hypothetical protein